MKIRRIVDSRLGFMSAAFLVLASVVAPAALTAAASAAVVTTRSIEMDSSAVSATNVKYTLTFTPSQSAGATVLEFCSDSPIIGDTCSAPGGFTVASVAADTGTAAVFESHNNVILWTNAITATPTTVEFSGITNPSATGPMYARLLTYTDATVAGTQYTAADDVGTYLDEGGFALSITNPINVSAAVRETLTFCVYGEAISANCTGASAAPNLELGEGDPKALSTTTASTGDIYTQISTNASAGAVVKMKTNNECGGLRRQGAASTDCGIPAVATGTNAISGGTAMFGMKVTTTNLTPTTNYAGANYGFNFDDGDATGVTSAYGDEVYNTGGDPVSSENATLNFAAAADNLTPAGRYQASLNLIATGTF